MVLPGLERLLDGAEDPTGLRSAQVPLLASVAVAPVAVPCQPTLPRAGSPVLSRSIER